MKKVIIALMSISIIMIVGCGESDIANLINAPNNSDITESDVIETQKDEKDKTDIDSDTSSDILTTHDNEIEQEIILIQITDLMQLDNEVEITYNLVSELIFTVEEVEMIKNGAPLEKYDDTFSYIEDSWDGIIIASSKEGLYEGTHFQTRKTDDMGNVTILLQSSNGRFESFPLAIIEWGKKYVFENDIAIIESIYDEATLNNEPIMVEIDNGIWKEFSIPGELDFTANIGWHYYLPKQLKPHPSKMAEESDNTTKWPVDDEIVRYDIMWNTPNAENKEILEIKERIMANDTYYVVISEVEYNYEQTSYIRNIEIHYELRNNVWEKIATYVYED